MSNKTKIDPPHCLGISVNSNNITLNIAVLHRTKPHVITSKNISLARHTLAEALRIIKTEIPYKIKRTVAGVSSMLVKSHIISTPEKFTALEVDKIIKETATEIFSIPYDELNYDYKVLPCKKGILINAIKKHHIEKMMHDFSEADLPLYAIESHIAGLARAATLFYKEKTLYVVAEQSNNTAQICIGQNGTPLYYKKTNLDQVTSTLELYQSQINPNDLQHVIVPETNIELINELKSNNLNIITTKNTMLTTLGHCFYEN